MSALLVYLFVGVAVALVLDVAADWVALTSFWAAWGAVWLIGRALIVGLGDR